MIRPTPAQVRLRDVQGCKYALEIGALLAAAVVLSAAVFG